ncbi:MAG: DUF3179 domain-containing protein [Desulfosarcina sp.]|nr:DUF3179 domain-containing protein [Desulfosarcina sp.]MBC2744549.1 DUF3179 domain-containing protein [Desulfosarcina sp.]MBC2767459.1 DUF3179 domain-containing protein [Desulfosarcina sp.]
MVYSSRIDDHTLTFRVSGRLYKSNVLIYDHQARSIPVIFAYWFAWQAFHPHTTVYLETQ